MTETPDAAVQIAAAELDGYGLSRHLRLDIAGDAAAALHRAGRDHGHEQPRPVTGLDPGAVRLVRDALRVRGYLTTIDNVEAPRVVAALAREYEFCLPGTKARLDALEKVAEAARVLVDA